MIFLGVSVTIYSFLPRPPPKNTTQPYSRCFQGLHAISCHPSLLPYFPRCPSEPVLYDGSTLLPPVLSYVSHSRRPPTPRHKPIRKSAYLTCVLRGVGTDGNTPVACDGGSPPPPRANPRTYGRGSFRASRPYQLRYGTSLVVTDGWNGGLQVGIGPEWKGRHLTRSGPYGTRHGPCGPSVR